MHITDIPTPSLLLDRARLLRNLERMRAAVTRHGIALRPHCKTAKSVDVARLATAGGDGIAVSTIAEAEYFADGGFRDILLGVAVTPEKVARLMPLAARGVRVTLLTDDATVARVIADSGMPALIEVDCGEGRSGVSPDGEALLEVARALGGSLAGVLTHAGHSYHVRGAAAFAEVAEQERSAAVTAAERLRAAGIRVDVVSVGSTPTALYAEHLDGVTDVRAGVYMFGDLFQAAIGSCAEEDIAVLVLASVIGHRRDEGILLLDAGALALSKDRSTERTDRDAGFGIVHAGPIRGIVSSVYQEHGLATTTGTWPWDELPIGSRVRILPNHACLTAAMHDRYHVMDGDVVVDTWGRCRGW